MIPTSHGHRTKAPEVPIFASLAGRSSSLCISCPPLQSWLETTGRRNTKGFIYFTLTLDFFLVFVPALPQFWASELAQTGQGRESLQWGETQRLRRPHESMEPGTGLDVFIGPKPREAP